MVPQELTGFNSCFLVRVFYVVAPDSDESEIISEAPYTQIW